MKRATVLVIAGPLVVGSRSWGHTQQEPENISFLASTVANKLFSVAAFPSTQTFVLSYRCLFNGRSETGTYDSESELTEGGLDETDRLTPRPLRWSVDVLVGPARAPGGPRRLQSSCTADLSSVG